MTNPVTARAEAGTTTAVRTAETTVFTVLFAMGRLPGWIAHWDELHKDPAFKIGRPRQIYTGPTDASYVPIEKR